MHLQAESVSFSLHLHPSIIHLFGFSSDIVSFPYGSGLFDFIFTFPKAKMSFWKTSPGPSWSDCIESLNPCLPQRYGICNHSLSKRSRTQEPKGYTLVSLSEKNAEDIERLLREDFQVYARCKITLSKERIRQGFAKDKWIGLGIYSLDKMLIGCCISKPLGSLKFPNETISNTGIVDYFCVKESHRKLGLASFLLQELVYVTALKGRLVHIFLKEGLPLWSVPPLYHSRFLVRAKQPVGEAKLYLSSAGIATHYPIQLYSHASYLPLTRFAANLPEQLSGDSELFVFNYKGHCVFLCMTDIHHRTAPDGLRIGELAWMLPQTVEVPLAIQKLAVETCIDASPFDLVLMDSAIPHDTKKTWRRDASFSWYCFNYNPGCFFTAKPFWIL